MTDVLLNRVKFATFAEVLSESLTTVTRSVDPNARP